MLHSKKKEQKEKEEVNKEEEEKKKKTNLLKDCHNTKLSLLFEVMANVNKFCCHQLRNFITIKE